VTREGAIPRFVGMLKSDNISTCEHAAWALWNLSVFDNIREVIAEKGGIPPLIMLLQSENENVQEQAAGALRNLSVKSGNVDLCVCFFFFFVNSEREQELNLI